VVVLAIEAIRCPPRWPRHAVEERAGGGGGATPRDGLRGAGGRTRVYVRVLMSQRVGGFALS